MRRIPRPLVVVLAVLALFAAAPARAQIPGEPERPPGLPGAAHAPIRVPPPAIQVTSPPPGATFHEERVRLVGAVTSLAGVADVSVSVNEGATRRVEDFDRGARLVRLEATLDLRPGDNVIRIVVGDVLGRRVSREIKVRRSLALAAERSERWAVVIGVRKYRHAGIPARRFADNDARSVADLLTTRGGFKPENVRRLHDGADAPTLSNIREALGEWLLRHTQARDSVVIYFAGRGTKDDERAYLMPQDADPGAPEGTAIDLEQLEGLVRSLRAQHVLMVFDAPFGAIPGGVAGATTEQQYMSLLTRSAGRAVISASGVNEDAVELAGLRHGLFTHHLLRALEGLGDADRDGSVSGQELFRHVESAVSDHARNLGIRQRPVIHGNAADVPVIATTRANRR